ncbi:hypothetical protein FDP41_006420 [Naegleria fowleri]|uniref:Uncharacterized protein n=1 Tax=Naegleria fowleri TaxID=5763 RepID=A0A6A5BJU2_NAEFO|nr:uncharacterized protein FDP41_006420 [Naegleria fowleri]KAF0974388.1 hypothetical protein FDP41_006420 [Naegleria fowleri]
MQTARPLCGEGFHSTNEFAHPKLHLDPTAQDTTSSENNMYFFDSYTNERNRNAEQQTSPMMHEYSFKMDDRNDNCSSSLISADHLRLLLFRHQNLRAFNSSLNMNNNSNNNNSNEEQRWDSKADASKCSNHLDHPSPLITGSADHINTTTMKPVQSKLLNANNQEKPNMTQKGLSCLEPKWLKQKFECDMARSSPTLKTPSNEDLDHQQQSLTAQPVHLTNVNQPNTISSEKKPSAKSTQTAISKSKKKSKKRTINTNPKSRQHATIENSQKLKSFNAVMIDLFKDYTEQSPHDLSLTTTHDNSSNTLYSKISKTLKRFNFWWNKWKKEFTAATIHQFLRSYDPLMRTFECLLLFFDAFHFPMSVRLFTHRVRHFFNLIFQFLYASLFLLEENSEAERELLIHSNNNYYNDSQIYQTDPYYYYDDVNYYYHQNPTGDPFT